MERIFYSLAFFFIVHEIRVFLNPKPLAQTLGILEGVTKKESTPSKNKETLVLVFMSMMFQLLYMAWAFIGIFTSQWLLFILGWILSFITDGTNKNITWLRVDAFLSVVILVMIVVNKFIIQFDFTMWLKSLFA